MTTTTPSPRTNQLLSLDNPIEESAALAAEMRHHRTAMGITDFSRTHASAEAQEIAQLCENLTLWNTMTALCQEKAKKASQFLHEALFLRLPPP